MNLKQVSYVTLLSKPCEAQRSSVIDIFNSYSWIYLSNSKNLRILSIYFLSFFTL